MNTIKVHHEITGYFIEVYSTSTSKYLGSIQVANKPKDWKPGYDSRAYKRFTAPLQVLVGVNRLVNIPASEKVPLEVYFVLQIMENRYTEILAS